MSLCLGSSKSKKINKHMLGAETACYTLAVDCPGMVNSTAETHILDMHWAHSLISSLGGKFFNSVLSVSAQRVGLGLLLPRQQAGELWGVIRDELAFPGKAGVMSHLIQAVIE